MLLQSQPLETRRRQDNRVELAVLQLRESRIDIAAQRLDGQIRAHQPELRLAAQARAADPRTLRQRVQRRPGPADQRIRVVGPFENRCQAKAGGHLGRDILHGMDGDIRLARLHRNFEFLDEQALAADFLQAAIENLVAAGRHRDEFYILDAGQVAQQAGNVICLPQRQRALARSYAYIQVELPSFQAASNARAMPPADH